MGFVRKMISNQLLQESGDAGNEVRFFKEREERRKLRLQHHTTGSVVRGEGKVNIQESENYEETFKQFNYVISLMVCVITILGIGLIYMTHLVDEKNYRIEQLKELTHQQQETYNDEYNHLLQQYKKIRDKE